MVRTGWSKQAVLKYLLLQIPGTLLVAALLWLIHRWTGLSLWVVWTLLAAWIAKDVALFFFVWPAYEQPERSTSLSLIGSTGTARERLAPEGYILIHGQLWRARLIQGHSRVSAGGEVEVLDRQGLVLLVQPAGGMAEPASLGNGRPEDRI